MQPYKIIWFEDDPQIIEDVKQSIEEHLKKLSKKLEITTKDQYSKDFDVTMFEGEYCLAIIDLNLNNNDKGTDLVNHIRAKGAFIDILLYSNTPEELMELTEGKNYIEGIFRHANTGGLDQKIKDVIDQLNYKDIMSGERLRKYNESTV